MSDEAKNGLVLIDFGGDVVDRARLFFSIQPANVHTVVFPAIKRTANLVRRETTKAIREKYDISVANLRAEENVQMYSKIGEDKFYTYIHYRAYKGIPLFRFNGVTPKYPKVDTSKLVPVIMAGLRAPIVKSANERRAQWQMVYPGVEASAHVLKGNSNKKLENTFVATMKSGHTGIFKRTGAATSGLYGGNDEIQELYGPNIVQMLGNREVQDKITQKAEAYFVARIEHEIDRLWAQNFLSDEQWGEMNR